MLNPRGVSQSPNFNGGYRPRGCRFPSAVSTCQHRQRFSCEITKGRCRPFVFSVMFRRWFDLFQQFAIASDRSPLDPHRGFVEFLVERLRFEIGERH
jgi:hypothetical protein